MFGYIYQMFSLWLFETRVHKISQKRTLSKNMAAAIEKRTTSEHRFPVDSI